MRWIQRTGLMLLVLLLSACSGAQPYQYHNELEEPSGPGLFTGSDEKTEESSTSKAKE